MHGIFYHLGSRFGQVAGVHLGLWRVEELDDAPQLLPHILLTLKTAIQFLPELLLIFLGLRFEDRLLPFVSPI